VEPVYDDDFLLPVWSDLWWKMGMHNQPSSPTSRHLKDHFRQLTDPRIGPAKRHELLDILMIAVCAMLCGAEGFTEIAECGRCKADWFQTWLALPHGIPSHDTFNRVFGLIDPTKFMDCFLAWTQSLREVFVGELVALDGKTLRRSRARGHGPIHLVNVWAARNRLVLGQLKVADHSNEITALPELLRTLELAGCVVTVDAMGCQKDVAKGIHEADAEYVLALKGNQGTLHAEIQEFLDDAQTRGFAGVAHQFVETVEKDHGRIETRRYWLTEQIGWLADKDQWEALRSVGMVEAVREVEGTVTTQRRYYLSSLPAQVEQFAAAVRGHWEIENCVHWVLDVQMGEDRCMVRQQNAAQNLAALRALCLNQLRRNQQVKLGIRGKQKAAGWDHNYLRSLLNF
jgi:predicted transposase YbfD/YdcC